jgi:hypothetical protein
VPAFVCCQQVFPASGDPGADRADRDAADLRGLRVGQAEHLGEHERLPAVRGEPVEQQVQFDEILEPGGVAVVAGLCLLLVINRQNGDPGGAGVDTTDTTDTQLADVAAPPEPKTDGDVPDRRPPLRPAGRHNAA